MTYPPPNPFDPQQQPGYGQPSAPQHYTTDADPYSRPDTYGPGTGYGNPPLNVHPGSAPPGMPYSPASPGYVPGQPAAPRPQGFQPPPPPGGAFQPGQAAPPPPRSGGNTTLIVSLVAVVLVVAIGGTFLALNLGGEEEDPVAQETSEAAEEETTEAAEETTAAEPSEEATTEAESSYRVPVEGECIENVTTGFYVVDCTSADAYWYVVHIAQSPADSDPSDPFHAVAAADACDGYEWTQYYYTDTAIAASRDWDPEIDSITAIYCVREVE
ncbi:hypothetical protein GCM10009830_17990 [Glycomyces endophyticus]|uniref:Uncharacterized protein n=1 Tax=Glycomyces endophyticus TaxID=480996 RepID=A0ABN2GJA8_9ACTN